MKVPIHEIDPLPTVEKGKSDWRVYKSFRLHNGVTCTVVNDKESKTTAVACAVHVGAAADPREMSGLAHFCEHMCFLGSEKYPGENDYKRYLSAHGGRSNASTSLHLTTYKFDVLAPYAEKALDIFSNFFIAPLFTLSGTSREVQAVDSENSKNLTSDARRRLQVVKDIADQSHYYSKFTTGNASTLPAETEETERVRSALLAFHIFHYQPQNITVVIVGPQSLEQLEKWIIPRFGEIPSKQLDNPNGEVEMLITNSAKDMPEFSYGNPVPTYSPAFTPRLQNYQWPILITLKPLRSMRKLTLNFPLPPTRHLLRKNPTHVLSHLLGHEGPGSPFSVLQTAGMLSALSAGCRISGPDQTVFQVDLSLTELGEKEWKQVVALILEHCRLIRKEKDLQRFWNEKRTLAQMQFHHASPRQAYVFAPMLAQSIVSCGTKLSLSSDWILEEEIPDIEQFVSCLAAENCFLERCSEVAWNEMKAESEFDAGFGKKKERWYGIDYYLINVRDFSNWERMDKTDLLDPTTLHLPTPNRFIPRSLELVEEVPIEAREKPRICKEIDPPKLILNNHLGRLWHRLDDRYALPKSHISFLIRNPAVHHRLTEGGWEFDPEISVHSSMLTAVFSQALAQETYDAELAGLHWNLSSSTAGICLTCFGYSDRLSDLAIQLLQDFFAGDFIQDSYSRSIKDHTIRSLRTYLSSGRADSHAAYYQNLLFSPKQSEVAVSLELAKVSTLESIKAHHRRVFESKEIEIDCLYTGNVSEQHARNFFLKTNKLFSGLENAMHSRRPRAFLTGPEVKRLNCGQDFELHFGSENKEEENGAVLMTFQSMIPGFCGKKLSGIESLNSSASIRLLCHMLREPLFNSLRTKQQLGYVVSSYYDSRFCLLNDAVTTIDLISVVVLTRKVAPAEAVVLIDEFLREFKETLLSMPESEIETHAKALSEKLMKPIQQLSTEATKHFDKIRRFGPSIIRDDGDSSDLPWKSAEELAAAIRSVRREDLLKTWDCVVIGPQRARVASMVYGSTFLLDKKTARQRATSNTSVLVNDTKEVAKARGKLKVYDKSMRRFSSFSRILSSSTGRFGLAVAGLGIIGFSMLATTKKRAKTNR